MEWKYTDRENWGRRNRHLKSRCEIWAGLGWWSCMLSPGLCSHWKLPTVENSDQDHPWEREEEPSKWKASSYSLNSQPFSSDCWDLSVWTQDRAEKPGLQLRAPLFLPHLTFSKVFLRQGNIYSSDVTTTYQLPFKCSHFKSLNSGCLFNCGWDLWSSCGWIEILKKKLNKILPSSRFHV